MLATIPSATLLGVDGLPVTVEVHVATGLPAFTVIGSPDTTCRESHGRVRAAMENSGLGWPSKRITINLAPSEQRKMGASLDLAIAVGILVANGEVPADRVAGLAFLGELGLDGSVRPNPGTLSLVDAVGEPAVVVAAGAFAEASLAGPARLIGVGRLAEVVDALQGGHWPPPPEVVPPPAAPPIEDLSDVRGQPVARFAMEVAAAGGHHVLLCGPPGSGKTMLARRLVGLLPDLEPADALQVTRVHSAAGLRLAGGLVNRPPFRAPHHGASAPALVGGGSGVLRPGEVSCATGGVLFLDELGEFDPVVLDALRQPLEEGVIRVARANARAELPARFQLVAATNPCPCGEGGPPGSCRCSMAARQRYHRRLSGPLLDRFDIRLQVSRPDPAVLLSTASEEGTVAVGDRVAEARSRARRRGTRCNADLRGPSLDAATPLPPPGRVYLEGLLRAGQLSARGVARVRAVARTVADLEGRDEVDIAHLSQAVLLRGSVGPFEGRLAS